MFRSFFVIFPLPFNSKKAKQIHIQSATIINYLQEPHNINFITNRADYTNPEDWRLRYLSITPSERHLIGQRLTSWSHKDLSSSTKGTRSPAADSLAPTEPGFQHQGVGQDYMK